MLRPAVLRPAVLRPAVLRPAVLRPAHWCLLPVLVRSHEQRWQGISCCVELYEEGVVYRIAADALIVFHLLWIFWLMFGALVAYRYLWLRAIHLAGLVFSVTMQVYGWYCPLTHLEQWLRYQQAPDTSYAGSFIAHYAERVIYLDVSPYLVLVLTLLICAGTAYIYLTWRPPAK